MAAYDVNGTTVEHDEEGYITNLSEWTKELADVISDAEGSRSWQQQVHVRTVPIRPGQASL